ncbi:MAG: malate dehydrogenase [Dehalococcoidia bacterium]|nr:MAG: malate dehydrogenase [Dehalococcoidia bacterium]
MVRKVSVIGAGNVGANLALYLAEKDFADIIILDIIDGLPQGKALDIFQSSPITDFNSLVIGTNDYRDTTGSDVVVITSGSSRKPGMTRNELLEINAKIVSEVTHNLVKYSPDCIILVVTNPVDTMTYLALKISGFKPNRVMGLSGVLDGARLSSFIASKLKASPADVSSLVLGEHGKNMLIIPRLVTVRGKPITKLLPMKTINQLIERTINGGAEIVSMLKTGSAFYAPAAAAALMVEAIVKDKKEVLPCAAFLQGEYGIEDVVIGVPVKLGKNGIEEIVELELVSEEKVALQDSAREVRQLIESINLP